MAANTNGRLRTLLNRKVQKLRKELERAGSLYEAPARLDGEAMTLAMASDVGSKRFNQDSVYLFQPEQPSPLRWAVAIADGVSSSHDSELGSTLACHAALAALKRQYASSGNTNTPRNQEPQVYSRSTTRPHLLTRMRRLATRKLRLNRLRRWTRRACVEISLHHETLPVLAADALFRDIGNRVRRRPEWYQPESLTNSSWIRTLRDGRYLQTTLMVTWQFRDELHIDGVGDGGFSIDFTPESFPLVFQPDSDKPVRCLGPHSAIGKNDYSMVLNDWHRLLLYTDGVTPALAQHPGFAKDIVNLSLEQRGLNSAEAVLSQFINQVPELIDDNVTLFSAARRN